MPGMNLFMHARYISFHACRCTISSCMPGKDLFMHARYRSLHACIYTTLYACHVQTSSRMPAARYSSFYACPVHTSLSMPYTQLIMHTMYTSVHGRSFFFFLNNILRLNIQKNKIIAKFGLMHLLATNFLNNILRLNIQKNKIIAKFGLMHLLATNCCIWIRTLVRYRTLKKHENTMFKGNKHLI